MTERSEICRVTGFLETGDGFTSKAKTAFLKALKTHGNQSLAADQQGVTYETVAEHLSKDLVFKAAFQKTLVEMRHMLEAKFFTSGLKGKSKDAKMWLETYFPEDFAAASRRPRQKANEGPLDGLLDKLDK